MFHFYRWMYNLVGFSTSQTNGFLVLLPLLAAMVFSPVIYRKWAYVHHDYAEDQRKLDSLLALWPMTSPHIDTARQTISAITPQSIDPNTASMTDFLSMGLPERLAGRIISYRKKGGTFKIVSDLRKIYGMDSILFSSIQSYIALPDRVVKRYPEKPKKLYTPGKSVKEALRFDINLADTSQLKKVYGIGEKLSLRIIKYREALGGFISLDQLAEIYRLDTVVIKNLKKVCFIEATFTPKKINLNTVDREILGAHPYLSRRAADAIVAYRFQHGQFRTIDDLRAIKVLDSLSLNKMKAYLEVHP
ncbi:MAG TPA: helix-hairpin-helix domain-containing protein [Ohtaekwangia sp.]|nr:helix-hairpin-helix domain-containing protein [Ohtaekwangia sp.]